jgi:ketosteroid isomerase-like protein
VRTTLAAVRERVTADQPFESPRRTPAHDFAREVFRRVDRFHPADFAELFAQDGKLVFAKGDPMIGPAAIDAVVSAFFTTIKGLRHEIVSEWHQQGDTVLELAVTYDRLDGKPVTIPIVTIYHRRDDGLIGDYRGFFDLAPVYA